MIKSNRLLSPQRLGITLSVLFCAGASWTASAESRVLLVPLQPIYRSVPEAKVQEATRLLETELGKKPAIKVLRAGTTQGAVPSADLAKPRATQKEAEAAERGLDIARALELRKAAVDQFTQSSSALEDAGELVLAYLYLARAQMWAGDDAAAKATLAQVARMDTQPSIPAAEFSRLFRRWFQDIALELSRSAKGKLIVEAGLPGARIFLDGRDMSVAPVTIENVVSGEHLLSAQVEGVLPFASMVQVAPNAQTRFTVEFKNVLGGSAVGAIADDLAENKFSSAKVQTARLAGRDAKADFVVLGAIAQNDANFAVYAFVIDVKTGGLHQLKTVSFDKEMLTAESDVLRLVVQIEGLMKSFQSNATQIARIETRVSPRQIMSVIDGNMEAPSKVTRKKPSRKGPRRVYRALRGGNIKIKDDEE